MFVKHVQKLLFSNGSVYVWSMSYFQISKNHKVKEFLKVNEPLLRALIKEPPRTNKRGRKRIAKGEVGKSSYSSDRKARIEGIAWMLPSLIHSSKAIFITRSYHYLLGDSAPFKK